jgi:hypothetical protein
MFPTQRDLYYFVMKNTTSKTLSLLVFTLFSLTSFGQNSINDSLREIKTEPHSNQVTTFNKKGVQTISVGKRRPVQTAQDKIEAIQSHIQAIDTKVEYINSVEELRQKAIKDSWFENMETIRKELVQELNELQNQ